MINYDFPLGASGVESYVHRIGRTARAQNKGSAYTFFTQRDGRMAGELSALLVRCRQVCTQHSQSQQTKKQTNKQTNKQTKKEISSVRHLVKFEE